MDRTVIDTWKAEEKEFGEKLHTKLTVLTTLIQPPTEDFKKCFVPDMFLKPNQKAFFHVMHYLFTLLDPLEFKKRFYWPIADKKSEANFRSSTVQYLMHLNEKHNLQWANVKSYLVVMPGGMKFIVFLLDLVDFIVKELIKQREKPILGDMTREQFSEFSIDRMRAQNKIHKEYASRYVKAIDLQIANLKENTENLWKHINSISFPNVKTSELFDDSVLSEFAASNRQLFKNRIQQKVEKIVSIEEPLKELKEKLDRFQNHEAGVKYDKEMVKRSLLKLKVLYPDLEVGSLMHGSDLQMGTLLKAFNRIYPDLECNIIAVDQQGNRNDFIGKELLTLKTDILQVETQTTKFLSSISGEFKNPQTKIITPVRQNSTAPNGASILFSKFVNTPPIKLDMIDNKMNTNPRLPFLDDFAMERSIESFCFINQQNTLFPAPPRSAKKSHDTSVKLNQSTVGKSKIVDPLRLLRTLNKDTSKAKNSSRNLSSLQSKWKKHEDLFGREEADTSSIDIDGCKTMVSMSVEPPVDSNDNTTRNIYQVEIPPVNAVSDGNILFPRKISAVKKVQDASLNFQNLSTSPSGRLDPLVPFDIKEFPKILLNDRTILENLSSSSKIDFLDVFNADKSFGANEDINKSFRAKPKPSKAAAAADENNPNLSNILFDLKENDSSLNSDAIFDISDGVLKDVTM
ncbi:augmin complex subunit dgt6 isoform X2 [Episyrphus balteatus]|nr:augmin complex subunit dgt6 isoform X2 [Episyrphus balteatus]